MSMDYYSCDEETTFNIKARFIADESIRSSKKLIDFRLTLKREISNWIQVSDYMTEIEAGYTPATCLTTANAVVPKFPKRVHLQKVVERAIKNCQRQIHDFDDAIIDGAWEKVRLMFEEDKTLINTFGIIKLECVAEMHQDNIYVMQTEYPLAMIPAASQKYEEEEKEDDGDCCCCACLDAALECFSRRLHQDNGETEYPSGMSPAASGLLLEKEEVHGDDCCCCICLDAALASFSRATASMAAD